MLSIEKYLSKVASLCGFKVEGERGYSPLDEIKQAIAEDTGGAKPLAELSTSS